MTAIEFTFGPGLVLFFGALTLLGISTGTADGYRRFVAEWSGRLNAFAEHVVTRPARAADGQPVQP